MLVLTRKVQESIMIGDDVEVTVTSVDGDQVRLGISAPSSVRIFRREVYDSIREENIRAAAAGVDDLEAALDVDEQAAEK